VLVILLLAAFIGLLIVTPLDVFHLHLFVKPGPFVSSAGLALYVVGFWIAYLALHENAFASPVVKYQEERNQTVVASGVYSVVRHPMYAGGLLLTIGLPLWLESYVGALFAIVAIATIFAARSVFEERFLGRNLPGYDAYAKRVRFRLIPFLW